MNWRFFIRGLGFAYGLFLAVRGIVHMRTPGYAATHIFRGALHTPGKEVVCGIFVMVFALVVPYTKYNPY
jgi:hypothetical protein